MQQDAADSLYCNTICLAPMVRSGTLPLRLQSLRYGADSVYSEEIIDRKIVTTHRIQNHALDTIDYVSINGNSSSVVFRTCEEEKQRIVYQMGSSDAVRALQAAHHVEKDVAAIDLNMGCPKHFSIQGGMGAALLSKPEVAEDIVKTLRRNINLPVSCKIRILENTEKTIDLIKILEHAGVNAIAVHARQTHESPNDRASWSRLTPLVSASSVPIIANGDIFLPNDIQRFKQETGCHSVMIARGALLNPSIFCKTSSLLPIEQVIEDYLKLSIDTGNVYQNTKYNLMRMMSCKSSDGSVDNSLLLRNITVKDIASTKNAAEMYGYWGLEEYYSEKSKLHSDAAKLHQDIQLAMDAKAPNHSYDDNFFLQKEESKFYCHVCSLNLLSQKDLELHVKGKKHKKVARMNAAATSFDPTTLSDFSAKKIKLTS